MNTCQQSFLLPDWLTVRTRSPRLRGNSRGDRNALLLFACFVRLSMPRGARSKNFYRDLNCFSTADFYESEKKKQSSRGLPGVFKVERSIAVKECKVSSVTFLCG